MKEWNRQVHHRQWRAVSTQLLKACWLPYVLVSDACFRFFFLVNHTSFSEWDQHMQWLITVLIPKLHIVRVRIAPTSQANALCCNQWQVAHILQSAPLCSVRLRLLRSITITIRSRSIFWSIHIRSDPIKQLCMRSSASLGVSGGGGVQLCVCSEHLILQHRARCSGAGRSRSKCVMCNFRVTSHSCSLQTFTFGAWTQD